jgi:hypothetical protein
MVGFFSLCFIWVKTISFESNLNAKSRQNTDETQRKSDKMQFCLFIS